MKKLEIIIKSENLEDLKKILTECNANEFEISKIKDYNEQKGYKKICRGTQQTVNFLPKIKVETIIDTIFAEVIIDKILKEINSGNYAKGKIFISNIENVIELTAI